MEPPRRQGRNPFRRRHHPAPEAPAAAEASGTADTVRRFLSDLHSALAQGHVSRDTEAHLRHVFRSLGYDADPHHHAAQVDREVERLEREAFMLKTLRQRFFGSA